MKNDEFETPQWLFDQLNEEFNFDLDVAASHTNHKCRYYFHIEDDALDQPWGECITKTTAFMNPPYSRGQLFKWCAKATAEQRKGVTVVGLLPVDTSTVWFHMWIYKNTNVEIRFLPQRLRFELNGVSQGPARFASMVVIWRGVK